MARYPCSKTIPNRSTGCTMPPRTPHMGNRHRIAPPHLTACGKTQIFVIPRRTARRGISLFLGLNQRGIPHFVRNDKIDYFFRSLCSHSALFLNRTLFVPCKDTSVKKNLVRRLQIPCASV